MFTDSRELLGIPLDVLLKGLIVGWMLIGAGLVWDSRSPLLRVLAFAIFTVPATLAIVLGPAVILILQNLP